MREIVPGSFRCREHDHELTDEVMRKLTAAPTRVSSFGFRLVLRNAPKPFTVVVRCPAGEGHDLKFSGTYRS
jgi:hypothetical protein